MIYIAIIFMLMQQIRTSCNYQSFASGQLDGNSFYQEKSYIRGTTYAFGVWTMYAPLRDNYYYDSTKTYYEQTNLLNGYHILNFQNDGKIQTLYYLQPVYFNMNKPYPTQQILQWTTAGVVYYNFQYHPYYYEGYWIFTYFSFSYQKKYNFATYNTGNNAYGNYLVTNKVLQPQTTNAKLEYGGSGQYKISYYSYNLNFFPGRISVITIMDTPTFFYNNQQAAFLSYITSCYIPTACPIPESNVILGQVYNEGNLTLRQFNVDVLGLRFYIEFWLKRDMNVDSGVMEHIFSYGAQFRSLAYYKQLMLYGKPALPDMSFINKIQSFYAIPTDDYQSQINTTNLNMQIPQGDFSRWNYFRYEFTRFGTYQQIKFSIYQANGDGYYQFVIYANPYYFQYSNYQATISVFTDILDISPGQMEPFKGDIANFRISYCYSGDVDFVGANLSTNAQQLDCHPLCKTCNGPTQWDCTTCYTEQNRFLRINSCICLNNYYALDTKCQEQILNIPQTKVEYTTSSIKCKYGQFEIWESDQFKGCLPCPYLNLHGYQCIDCLLGSQNWQTNPICSKNFETIDGLFYEIQEVEVEYFSINIELMTVQLCVGCQSKTQCKQNRYRQNNFCITCAVNCATCNNHICLQCENGYYLKNNYCYQCNQDCVTCNHEQLCTLCPEQATLRNGQCIKCGQNCQECEIRLNNNQEYRKCLKCLHNTYISLDGESCYYNSLEFCRQPFQYSVYNITISTIIIDFQPQEKENIITGCIHCSFSYLNIDDSYKCVPMSATQFGGGCIFSVTYQQQNYCLIGSQNLMLAGISFCYQNIPFCPYCIIADLEFLKHCYLCDEGYYNDYYTSLCQPCPNECTICYQSDSSKINKALVFGVFIMTNSYSLASYRYATQNTDQSMVYIYCQKCQEGYTLYENQCILNCPSNCQECIVVNLQNVCISCFQINSYSYFQLQDGKCIPCPSNCKLCKPRTISEQQQMNPYFVNEDFYFFSHACVVPNDDSYFYDQDLKQFIQCEQCEKSVDLEINVYCLPQQILDPFQMMLEQLFNSNESNNITQIETEDYFQYLNKEFVKYVNYKIIFQQQSTCTITKNAYLQSKFQQNVFNILKVNLIIEGNNSTLILNANLTLSNYSSIMFQNLIIQGGGFIFSSMVPFQVQMYNLTIFSKNLLSLFILNNARSVLINQMAIIQSNLNQNSSIIYLNNTNTCSFIGSNITISDSKFTQAYFIKYDSGQVQMEFQYILIKNSFFTQSQFINTNSSLIIEQFLVNSTIFMNSNGFFLFQDSVILNNFRIFNCALNQTLLIIAHSDFYLRDSEFSDLQITNNSTLLVFKESFKQVQLINIDFRDIQYQNGQAILLIKQVQEFYMAQITLQSVQSIEKEYQQSSSQSLFYIEADSVEFQDLSIERGIGYSEFSLINVKKFNFLNSTILLHEQFYYKTIAANPECIVSKQFGTFMFLQDVLEFNFQSITIQKIIIFDSLFIDYVFSDNLKKPSLKISNCTFMNNILHQSTAQSRVSLLRIESGFSLDVIMQNNQYIMNLLKIGVMDNSHRQGLLFAIDASSTQISGCNFTSNFIINGSSSIMQIISDSIVISNSNFQNNSIFQYETIRNHLIWTFEGLIHLEDLQHTFPVDSFGGNGYLQGQNIQIRDGIVANSFSRKGAGFAINILENGILFIQNSTFKNLNTNFSDISSGGCFYILSYSTNLKIEIVSSTFESISTKQTGGILHIQTLTKVTSINFLNSRFINIFAIQGSLLYVDILQQSTIHMVMDNCVVQNVQKEFEEFINNIQQITSNDLSILQEYSSLIYFLGGTIVISNLTIEEYPPIQLFYFQNSVIMSQIKILNTHFTKSLINFNKNTDPSTIRIQEMVILNCSLLLDQEIQLIQNRSSSGITSSSCLILTPPQEIQSKNKEYDNSNYLNLLQLLRKEDVISLIIFNNFQHEDSLHMNNIHVQVNCSNCQQGVVGLLKFSDPVIQITGLSITNSYCGISGCISISSSKSRLLSGIMTSRSTIYFSNLLCLNNYAKYGGCLYIQNQQITIRQSRMINNTALFGGAVYIIGSSSILDASDLDIINNTANIGSGLYSFEPFLQSQTGITYMNNINNTLFQPPSMLHVKVFDNLTLTPTTFFQDKYHKIDKILSQGNEIILYVPTGIKISSYRRFDLKLNSYNSQSQMLQLIALNDQLEINELSNTLCKCSVIDENGSNNLLSQTVFYFNQTTYNLDDLILYLPQNKSKQYWLNFWCDSIYIPIIENGAIIGYHQNYSLQLRVIPYECQLGEYHIGLQDYCHQCLVEMQQYSVVRDSTFCSTKDQRMKQITPAQIELIGGYWRYTLWSPDLDLCYNMKENCIGGWNVGNDLCLKGYIGALCEQCDFYNTQGHGYYTQSSQFKCQLCQQSNYNHLITLIVTLIFFALIYRLILFEEQQRQRGIRQLIFLKANWKLEQTTIIQCIKIILQYFQIISLVGEFKTHFNDVIKTIIDSLGNPFQQLIIINSCHLIYTDVSILYLDLIQNTICLIIIISVLLCFRKQHINNFAYLIYVFFGMSVVRTLLKQLSVRSLQGENWIYQNVAYIFHNYRMIALLCFLPILIILSLLIPTLILIYLKNVQHQVMKQFGLWFTAYNNYWWEAIKLYVTVSILFSTILIDNEMIMRCLFAYGLLLLYMSGGLQKLIDSKNIYFNQKLNDFEQYLHSFSICILVTSSFYQVVNIQPFLSIIHYIIIICILYSLLIIIHFLIYFNYKKIRTTITIVLRTFIKRYPALLDYEFFYKHSDYSQNEYDRRLLLLKRYVQIIIIQNKKQKDSSSKY